MVLRDHLIGRDYVELRGLCRLRKKEITSITKEVIQRGCGLVVDVDQRKCIALNKAVLYLSKNQEANDAIKADRIQSLINAAFDLHQVAASDDVEVADTDLEVANASPLRPSTSRPRTRKTRGPSRGSADLSESDSKKRAVSTWRKLRQLHVPVSTMGCRGVSDNSQVSMPARSPGPFDFDPARQTGVMWSVSVIC